MPEADRPYEVSNLTVSELERAGRELHATLALTRENSPAQVPIVTQLNAVEAELAQRGCPMNLTSGQLARMGRLSDQWSFLWDKRRSLWIAAEDCPNGEQIEEPDLDILLAQLSSSP